MPSQGGQPSSISSPHQQPMSASVMGKHKVKQEIDGTPAAPSFTPSQHNSISSVANIPAEVRILFDIVCVCLCVCVCVSMCIIHTSVCSLSVCMYVCVYVRMCVLYLHTHVCMCVCASLSVCYVCVCMHACVSVCLCSHQSQVICTKKLGLSKKEDKFLPDASFIMYKLNQQ